MRINRYDVFSFLPVMAQNNKITIKAINIRCQTIDTAEFVISFPKIAVNPAIKTRK